MFHEYLEPHKEISGIPQAFILFTFHSEKHMNYFRSSNRNNTYIPHFKAFAIFKKLTRIVIRVMLVAVKSYTMDQVY